MSFSDSKLRWLVFTVLFGMVPILMRLLVSLLVAGDREIAIVAASDLISFGIVMQVSIFNEIRYYDLSDIEWKHRMMGMSALFMLMYAALYVVLLFSEVLSSINAKALLYISIGAAFVSFLLCYVFYDKMVKTNVSR